MKDKKKIPKGKGRVVSWMFGGKKYYGRFLRETDTHIFARTHNGKIKKIKKKGK